MRKISKYDILRARSGAQLYTSSIANFPEYLADVNKLKALRQNIDDDYEDDDEDRDESVSIDDLLAEMEAMSANDEFETNTPTSGVAQQVRLTVSPMSNPTLDRSEQNAPLVKIRNRNTNVSSSQLQSLIPLFAKYGVQVRITSLDRPGALTSNGSGSFHNGGHAMDIVPVNGDFNKLLSLLRNNVEIRQAMASMGVGYLDETSAAMLARTKGTGPHIHIGPDNICIRSFNNLI